MEIDWIKKWFTPYAKGEPDAFYWRIYLPLMKKIVADIKAGQANDHAAESPIAEAVTPPIFEQNAVKQVARVQDGKLGVYTYDLPSVRRSGKVPFNRCDGNSLYGAA